MVSDIIFFMCAPHRFKHIPTWELTFSGRHHRSKFDSGVLKKAVFTADVSSAAFSGPVADYKPYIGPFKWKAGSLCKIFAGWPLSKAEEWARLQYADQTVQARLRPSTLFGSESVLTQNTWGAECLGEHTMKHEGNRNSAPPGVKY